MFAKRRFPDAAYPSTLPSRVQGGGGAPRAEQRQSLPALAADLGVSSAALRRWLRQADADVGVGPPGVLTSDEREELRRLRREHQVLRQERELLKKAAACFAKEAA